MGFEVRVVHGQGPINYAHEMLAEWAVNGVSNELFVVLYGVPIYGAFRVSAQAWPLGNGEYLPDQDSPMSNWTTL